MGLCCSKRLERHERESANIGCKTSYLRAIHWLHEAIWDVDWLLCLSKCPGTQVRTSPSEDGFLGTEYGYPPKFVNP